MSTTSRTRILAALLATVVLIGGVNYAAYAANGKPLLLGKFNVETKKSILKNKGSGPALHLKTKPGQPPLAVNRSVKVNKLNADRVDGANAADLESLVHVYELPSAASAPDHEIGFPGLPPGLYAVDYTVITSGVQVACFMSNRDQGLTYSVDGVGGFSVNSGAAVIDTSSGADQLLCNGIGGNASIFSTAAGGLSEVTFTRLDAISNGSPTLSRPAAERPAAGSPTGR
ncbi:hypothetical protein GCM10027020_25300 [Nocardioides salsibiostraticola]